jgi:hypothetical protein
MDEFQKCLNSVLILNSYIRSLRALDTIVFHYQRSAGGYFTLWFFGL